jgi:NADPH:quinone reductase
MTSVPATMEVVEIAEPGGPDVLRLARRPVPQPGPGELLIKVAAAGVNRPDISQRLGQYPPPPGAPDILGLEASGTVASVGGGVTEWRVGDEVLALLAGGGYARYAVAPVPQCLVVPRGLSLVEAAGIPETFFTVWNNVFERGALTHGESFLVHGGSSGIGTTAIQLGRAFGARVFATAGSPKKCAACEALGAERAINYRLEDFVAVTQAVTGGRGIDVILDMVGGSYLVRNIEALAVEGRLCVIAFLHGARAEISLAPFLSKRLTLKGSRLRPLAVPQKGSIARALREKVWPLLESGAVRVVVHATFPLARVAEAHRLMEQGEHIGKIILRMDADS